MSNATEPTTTSTSTAEWQPVPFAVGLFFVVLGIVGMFDTSKIIDISPWAVPVLALVAACAVVVVQTIRKL